MNTTRYTFGTGAAASERLGRLHAVFGPVSLAWARRYAPSAGTVALDLGCGPGWTTQMLADAGCREVTGLEESAVFIAEAKQRFPACRFIRHDVTRLPLPVEPSLIYARFLLSHLSSPAARLTAWCEELQPDGLLLSEEVEAINTRVGLFRDYIAGSEALVRSKGGELFIGRDLAAAAEVRGAVENEAFSLAVPAQAAAAMFLPNARGAWEASEALREAVPEPQRRRIVEELAAVCEGRRREPDLTWVLRRIVLR